jgi:hypothetical protein
VGRKDQTLSGFTSARQAASSIVRFLALSLLYLGVGVLVVGATPVERAFVEPWTRWNAWGAAAFASILGVQTSAVGTQVSSGGTSLNVLNGCNGVHVVRLVTLIVVARYAPARLEQFHIYIWQPLMALIAFALFFVWASCFTLSGPKSATTGDAT